MRLARREAVRIGCGLVAVLAVPRAVARAADVVEIEMGGRADGARVWFDPVGIRVRPGQTVRWINRDAGNAHTATAYHPANGGRPRRIPRSAEPWDSGYLLPGESFAVTLTAEGVYDYFCAPHEHAGMVGRLVVGEAASADWTGREETGPGVPDAARRGFPPVAEIMEAGAVRRP